LGPAEAGQALRVVGRQHGVVRRQREETAGPDGAEGDGFISYFEVVIARGRFLNSPQGVNFNPQGENCRPGENFVPRDVIVPLE
jgi:hypothetical protein